MNDGFVMQVIKTAQGLPQHVLAYALGVLTIVHVYEGRQVSVHQLQKDPNAVSEVIRGVDLQHRLITLALIHQTDLIDNHVAVIFVLGLTEFESADKVVSSSSRLEHFSEATLSKFVLVLDLKVGGRVRCLDVGVTEKHSVFDLHLAHALLHQVAAWTAKLWLLGLLSV